MKIRNPLAGVSRSLRQGRHLQGKYSKSNINVKEKIGEITSKIN